MSSQTASRSILDRFESEYQRYHGLSDGRAREQKKVLGGLADHARKPLAEVTAADLRAYLASLDHLHPNTVLKRLKMIRPFFTWGFEVGEVSAEELMKIRLVKPPKGSTSQSQPRPYSSKELRQFWRDLDARWPIPKRFDYFMERYKRGTSRYPRIASMVSRRQSEAVLSLALECGLRRGEIFTAEIEHIHHDNACVIVPQRGAVPNAKDHFREVPHTEASRQSIKDWLELRHEIGVKHDRPWILATMFIRFPAPLEPISLETFQDIPVQIGHYEFHRFRHTAATLWLRAGMPIEKVQKLLGHANLQQTLAYAEIVTDDVRKAVSDSEPDFARLTRRKR